MMRGRKGRAPTLVREYSRMGKEVGGEGRKEWEGDEVGLGCVHRMWSLGLPRLSSKWPGLA